MTLRKKACVHAFLLIPLTIAAFVVMGKRAKSSIDDSVEKATGGAKEVMKEAGDRIESLLQEVDSTYGHALDTTLDLLDTTTSQQLAKLANLFDQINQSVMDDVGVISEAGLGLIKEAGPRSSASSRPSTTSVARTWRPGPARRSWGRAAS